MNAPDKALKKNIDQFIGKDAQLDDDALKPFANSKKIYIQGSTPDIQVPFREISISDTPSEFGAEKNAPVLVYDTSGPYTDPKYDINIQNGLPPLKTKWIEDRKDTEILDGPTSVYGREREMDPELKKCVLISYENQEEQSQVRMFPRCIMLKKGLLLQRWNILPSEKIRDGRVCQM